MTQPHVSVPPPAPDKAPIHPKVIAATLGALVAGLLSALIVWTQANLAVTDHLPTALQGIVALLLPALAAFLAGYAKRT